MGLSEPKKINYLNFADVSKEYPFETKENPLKVNFYLSQKVTLSTRVVHDIFMMFGEVGGLYDFLALGIAIVLGFFSERQLMASLVEKLLHRPPNESRKEDAITKTVKQTINFDPLYFNASFIFFQSCIMGCCYRDKKLHR